MEFLALVFDEKFELITIQGIYTDYDHAWNIGMLKNDNAKYCIPVNIDDYFEGMEDYLSDAMKQVSEVIK